MPTANARRNPPHLLLPRAAWSINMETEILSDEELADLTGYKARAYWCASFE